MNARNTLRDSLRLILGLMLAVLPFAPATAREIRNREELIALISEVAAAATPAEIHRILRRYGDLPATEWRPSGEAHGVIWFDNSLPRARIILHGVKADACFRNLLADEFLLEAVDVTGRIDLELDVRADVTAMIRGRLRFHEATLRWTMGDFALLGVNGSIPFLRTIGIANTTQPAAALSTAENVRIDTVIWSNRPVAVGVTAVASYTDRILRFDQLRLKMLDGQGLGSVVFDHRGRQWRAAAMLRFENINLLHLPEILPSLPAMARVTMATIRGHVGLIYTAPDRLNLTGKIESTAPGVIELSPQMRERVRDLLDSRVIRFQRLTINLGRDQRGELEARIVLQRRTGQSIFSFFRGEPFAPYRLTIRFPIIPFVRQLSRY